MHAYVAVDDWRPCVRTRHPYCHVLLVQPFTTVGRSTQRSPTHTRSTGYINRPSLHSQAFGRHVAATQFTRSAQSQTTPRDRRVRAVKPSWRKERRPDRTSSWSVLQIKPIFIDVAQRFPDALFFRSPPDLFVGVVKARTDLTQQSRSSAVTQQWNFRGTGD